MKDVAKLAGVSVSTVSRVINNSLPVDNETRRRVEDAVLKTSFRPNLLARGLRSKSGNLIGLIVPEIVHESFSFFVNFAEASAERHGFNLVIGNTNNDPDKEEQFVRNFIRRHVDGVIFSRVSDQSRIFRIIEESQVPFVIIDRSMKREDVPTVVMDNYGAGVIAAKHLLDLGHEDLACITGPMNIAIVRDRFSGFRDTIVARGGRLPDSHVLEADFKFEGGKHAARRLLEDRIDFTALWAQNDLMAVGAMNEFISHGIAVPGDVSIMGLDNVTVSWMVNPALTTIAQPFAEMCESAVKMIVSMRAKESIAEWLVTHSPALVVRDTTSIRSSGPRARLRAAAKSRPR
ncbi:MAG TPA: LacI family DNA-binding transcriptional regulator [Spirochaetia bacterium]|nr:LacI family DNA-binding transcriptional regulator [Spirochaetia bacterium]